VRLRTLDDLDVAGKRVLVRSDLNVPLRDGEIADDFRIQASLPTIEELRSRGASQVVVCAHLGRPKGAPNPAFTLAPVAARLGESLGTTVPLVPLPPSPMPDDPVVLLENLRFDPLETRNDEAFAAALADLCDVYVNDAFGAAHRAHASVEAVAHLRPSAAGRLLQREVEVLGRLLEEPARPFVAVLGGSKVSDKLKVIESLLRTADLLVIGGAMCFTFLKARGLGTGRSLVEDDMVTTCAGLLAGATDRILLPTDIIVAPEMEEGAPTTEVPIEFIPDDQGGFDIGSKSAAGYVAAIRSAKTVMWNGPMGVFEIDAFAAGTRAVAEAVADGPATSVVGGGDSIAALEAFGFAGKIDHVSSGGGEFLEGGVLPGIAPLLEA
jgi:phosphoglycerate kinase